MSTYRVRKGRNQHPGFVVEEDGVPVLVLGRVDDLLRLHRALATAFRRHSHDDPLVVELTLDTTRREQER